MFFSIVFSKTFRHVRKRFYRLRSISETVFHVRPDLVDNFYRSFQQLNLIANLLPCHANRIITVEYQQNCNQSPIYFHFYKIDMGGTDTTLLCSGCGRYFGMQGNLFRCDKCEKSYCYQTCWEPHFCLGFQDAEGRTKYFGSCIQCRKTDNKKK